MKFAVVPVSCSDAPRVTTLTREWLHRATTHVAGYYLEQSGGRELMEFRVFEWTALPVTSAQWNAWGFDAGDHVRPLVAAAQAVLHQVQQHVLRRLPIEGSLPGGRAGAHRRRLQLPHRAQAA
jgi:hypothetical protein